MAIAPAASDQPKSSKKDKRNRNSESTKVSTSSEKKRHGEDEQLATPVAARDERPKKRKKVEQKDSSTNDAADVDNEEIELAKPKRPKRPKDKTAKASTRAPIEEVPPSLVDKIHIADIPVPYTNPLTDATLPELSQRGLAYAYQYAQHISLSSDVARSAQRPWKFNKGRQNWIIRNVTEPAVIPDPYLALAMVYIESIQGGARDALKKTCKATKRKAKAATKVQAEAAQPETVNSEGNPEPKQVTFAPTEAPVVSEEKRKRAKRILKVLKGKIQPQDA